MTSRGRRGVAETRLPVETRPLASGVFMTAVGMDVVVLDLASDRYSCLPQAADQLSLSPGLVRAELGLLGLLADAGLLGGADRPVPRPIPGLPRETLPTNAGLGSIAGAVFLVAAATTARRLGEGATIRALIEALPARPANGGDAARIASVTAAFTALLPWVPRQGACLYRAFVLLTMLRRAGADAAWVFGVRTWPFGAHCWLQVGDAVLDDDPERVSRYTPIMAV